LCEPGFTVNWYGCKFELHIFRNQLCSSHVRYRLKIKPYFFFKLNVGERENPLERYDHGFEPHSRHTCISAFVLFCA
jgi:hypothetical protein